LGSKIVTCGFGGHPMHRSRDMRSDHSRWW